MVRVSAENKKNKNSEPDNTKVENVVVKTEKTSEKVIQNEAPAVQKTVTKPRHVKSVAKKEAGKERAKEMKEKGLGLFANKKLSPELAAICDGDTLPRTEVVKRVWLYIKTKGLSKGRIITSDEKLKTIFPTEECGDSFDMLKMSSWLSKHFLSDTTPEPTPPTPPPAPVPQTRTRRVKA
tara:strand:+ start:1193 stop:1732 length:540 start_codon:yes stop_codon:yes gene_type:complete